MIVLGLDTATSATSVALCELDSCAGSLPAPARRAMEYRDDPQADSRPAHARALLALVDRALAEAGLSLGEVQRVAVGTGPGTFTGLRIGIATAKGLAIGAGIPLLGVLSLRALALGAREEALQRGAERICTLIDARRGELFVALWDVQDPAAQRPAAGPDALAPALLAQRLAEGPPTLAVGDGALALGAELKRAVALANDPALHRVSAVWHCRLAAAEGPPPDAVLPEYVRIPDAELARRQSR